MPTDAVVRKMRPGEAAACERILRSLPDWFGIEQAIVDYVRDIGAMETWVVPAPEEIVGFITVRRHHVCSAEIQVMAVLATHHGQGLGRKLVEHAERTLRSRSVEFLQVKTLAPSRPDVHYERTRGFYERMGFRPLEENRLWGEANPCLVMVKHLGSPAVRRVPRIEETRAGIRYVTRPEASDEELNALFANAWPDHEPRCFEPALSRALGHVCAYQGEELIGFVYVAWDGGEHAFLLDPTVRTDRRREGIGSGLVRRAVELCRESRAAWLHVDFEPHLADFYARCGFRDTAAGLIDVG